MVLPQDPSTDAYSRRPSRVVRMGCTFASCWGKVNPAADIAECCELLGNTEGALLYASEEALGIDARLDSRVRLAQVRGYVLLHAGDTERGEAALEEAIAGARRIEEPFYELRALQSLHALDPSRPAAASRLQEVLQRVRGSREQLARMLLPFNAAEGLAEGLGELLDQRDRR